MSVMGTPVRDQRPAWPLSPKGKADLRAAVKGLPRGGAAALARKVGMSASTLTGLIAEAGSAGKVYWASEHLPDLCRELRLPIWRLMPMTERRMAWMECLDDLEKYAPDEVDHIMADVRHRASVARKRATPDEPEGDPEPPGATPERQDGDGKGTPAKPTHPPRH